MVVIQIAAKNIVATYDSRAPMLPVTAKPFSGCAVNCLPSCVPRQFWACGSITIKSVKQQIMGS